MKLRFGSEPDWVIADSNLVSQLLGEFGVPSEHPNYPYYEKYILDKLQGTWFQSPEELRNAVLPYMPKTASQVDSNYLGTCKNLANNFFNDATEMAQLVENSKNVPLKEVLPYISEDLKKKIDKRLNDFFAAQYKNIVWVYDDKTDIHYFFELSNLAVSNKLTFKKADAETLQENFYEPGKSDEYPKGPKRPKLRFPFHNYPDEQGNIFNIDPNISNPMEYESSPGSPAYGPGICGSLNLRKTIGIRQEFKDFYDIEVSDEYPTSGITMQELKRLYIQEAKGIYDRELMDEIISEFIRILEVLVASKVQYYSYDNDEIKLARTLKHLIEILENAATPQEKMIAIDQTINTMHSTGKMGDYLIKGFYPEFFEELGNLKVGMLNLRKKAYWDEIDTLVEKIFEKNHQILLGEEPTEEEFTKYLSEYMADLDPIVVKELYDRYRTTYKELHQKVSLSKKAAIIDKEVTDIKCKDVDLVNNFHTRHAHKIKLGMPLDDYSAEFVIKETLVNDKETLDSFADALKSKYSVIRDIYQIHDYNEWLVIDFGYSPFEALEKVTAKDNLEIYKKYVDKIKLIAKVLDETYEFLC